MAVLNVQWPQAGQVPNTTTTGSAIGLPSIIFIQTNSTLAQATVAGFLNSSVSVYGNVYNNSQMALVYTTDSGDVWLRVSVSTVAGVTTYSLVTPTEGSGTFSSIVLNAGTAAAPSLSFTGDTDTGIYRVAANTVGISANGALVASIGTTGVAVTGLVSATTTVTGLTGVVAGASGSAASLVSFPATAANGSLIISALNAGGAFNTTIRNSAMGQSSVVSIPDPGAATSSFVLNNATVNSGTGAGSWGNATAPTPSKVLTISIGGVLYYCPLVAQNT